MRHFSFEEKEYRINPSFRRNRNGPDSAQALSRLLRQFRGPRARPQRSGKASKADARQNCVVKMQYSFSKGAHRLQLDRYLTREGTDQDGGKAQLYGTDLDEYRENMDDKNIRIFLSPESNRIDLTELTKNFVKKLEYQTGYKFYWEAANHYNTDHPHAHLLINGKDKEGRDVKLPKDVVKTLMREAARDLCTRQIGSRSAAEMALDKEKQLTANRWTRLDDRIMEIANGSLRVDCPKDEPDRPRLLKRLEHLRKLKLVTWKDNAYRLDERFEDNLRANGRYNTFLKARDELKFTSPANLRLYKGSAGEITGKVTKIYRTDGDASDSHAVILEGVDGKAYFVPLLKKPELNDMGKKTPLQEGQYISLKTYTSQKGRTTPVMQRKEAPALRKEIRFSGGARSQLAGAVLTGQADPKKERGGR